MDSLRATSVAPVVAAVVALLVIVLADTPITTTTAMAYPQKPPKPENDPFYRRPANLEQYSLGDVIRSRLVPVEWSDLLLEVREATQLVYRTNNTLNYPSWSVATILKPHNPKQPPQMVSVLQEEDSVSGNCASSYGVVDGLLNPDLLLEGDGINEFNDYLLQQGWYVVIPDQEGPQSTFLAGFEEGRAGLDSIRAARHHLRFHNSTEITIFGYSGGAHAAVWMTNLAGVYAPDLNIIGAAMGGTIVDLFSRIRLISGGISGLGYETIPSLARLYPGFNHDLVKYGSDRLNQYSRELPEHCVFWDTALVGRSDLLHEVKAPYKTILDPPLIHAVLRNESLLATVSPLPIYTPSFPRLFYQASYDENAPRSAAHQYIRERCADGDHIQSETIPGDHILVGALGLPLALQFLQRTLNHESPRVSKCGGSDPSRLTLDSDNVEEVLGKRFVEWLRARVGKLQQQHNHS